MAGTSGPRVPRSRVLTAVAVALLAGLLLGVLLGGPLLGLGSPGQPTPTPTEEVRFEAVTEGYDDRIVFRFSPTLQQPRQYAVTYDLLEGGNTLETARNRSVTLSASDPLVVTVEDPQPNTEYTLDIAIFRNDRRVHRSEITISQQRPTATT
ncbi:hypothetical protein [Haloglomus litoreum]|uniref:hypothetical protein n=1 Tax=Haloglomus litoreum TaxID=3034026 RepID=UPI0023E7E968|nr:hypothetical protein [Haloglomus sp. DT116]